ncbi:MAG: hypothetical protein ABSH53_22105 [Holophaga sp.]|jgi:hypothetical protein
MKLEPRLQKTLHVGSAAAIGAALIGFAAWVGLMVACAPPAAAPPPPPPQQVPVSAWGGHFSFSYTPPAATAEPASANATILVVNPSYKDHESAFARRDFEKIGKGFSASMGVDMDKILIAKGLTSKGPFSAIDELTYSDKKNSDLTLNPTVFITSDVKFGKWEVEGQTYVTEGRTITVMTRPFELRVGGWVSFVMQEPLSGEKMWIKKLELDEKSYTGKEYCEAKAQYHTNTTTTGNGSLFFPYQTNTEQVLDGYNPGDLLFSENVDDMAGYVKEIYPVVMKKCWDYIDPEEVNSLKSKVAEIRKAKVY